MRALERKGYIEMPGARAASACGEPRHPDNRTGGRGQPYPAEQHIQGRYQIDPALFKPRADYLLKVRGMSMRDAGIHDGDLLAVHKSSEARSGQVVVARVNDEVTVKRLRRRGAIIELLPENPEFEPIVVDTRREEFAIEGLGVGVIRAGKTSSVCSFVTGQQRR